MHTLVSSTTFYSLFFQQSVKQSCVDLNGHECSSEVSLFYFQFFFFKIFLNIDLTSIFFLSSRKCVYWDFRKIKTALKLISDKLFSQLISFDESRNLVFEISKKKTCCEKRNLSLALVFTDNFT